MGFLVMGNPGLLHCLSSEQNSFAVFRSGPRRICQLAVDGWRFCKRITCIDCEDSVEVDTMHVDCLALFYRTLTADNILDRLWLAVVWRARSKQRQRKG